MKRIMVQYKVKADRADDNQRLVEAVFAALHEAAPADFRYASFKGEDGVSFTHIVSMESADGSNPLEEIDAFEAFTEAIGERCDVPPQVTPLTEVGAYNFFG
jgi:hypothetical protein